jgi:hypothetical protein
MYLTCLESISRYVRCDLLGGTTLSAKSRSRKAGRRRWFERILRGGENGYDDDTTIATITPSSLLSARPADDPLEAILYLTSVGTPGVIYDTVRSLRQARSRRLGALQRKVPAMHMAILWLLGVIMISSFPILVGVGGASALASSSAGGGGSVTSMLAAADASSSSCCGGVLTMQGAFFGVVTFAVVMTKLVLVELWRTKAHSGAYNVDAALRVMVRGLRNELEERTNEATGAMLERRIETDR